MAIGGQDAYIWEEGSTNRTKLSQNSSKFQQYYCLLIVYSPLKQRYVRKSSVLGLTGNSFTGVPFSLGLVEVSTEVDGLAPPAANFLWACIFFLYENIEVICPVWTPGVVLDNFFFGHFYRNSFNNIFTCLNFSFFWLFPKWSLFDCQAIFAMMNMTCQKLTLDLSLSRN